MTPLTSLTSCPTTIRKMTPAPSEDLFNYLNCIFSQTKFHIKKFFTGFLIDIEICPISNFQQKKSMCHLTFKRDISFNNEQYEKALPWKHNHPTLQDNLNLCQDSLTCSTTILFGLTTFQRTILEHSLNLSIS